MGEIANVMVQKYKVGVICGPETYDKRKKKDVDNKYRLHESIDVYRASGSGWDKNTIKGKIMSYLLMSKRMVTLVRKNVQKKLKWPTNSAFGEN